LLLGDFDNMGTKIMNGFEQIKNFYSWVFNNQDKKITPQHISLYNFLINQNNRNNWVEWFKCPYDLAMSGSCIGNKKTYYSCLEDLQTWGLIKYEKGINNYKAPIIKVEVLNRTSTGTATVPQSEPLLVPLPTTLPIPLPTTLPIPLPTHIYKLITYNLKPITLNYEKFEKFILDLSIDENFDFDFCEVKLLESFKKWIQYRTEINVPIKTQMQLESCYKELMRISNNSVKIGTDTINRAIGNGWKSLVEIENKSNAKQESVIEWNPKGK
jgi:hypothetical protein